MKKIDYRFTGIRNVNAKASFKFAGLMKTILLFVFIFSSPVSLYAYDFMLGASRKEIQYIMTGSSNTPSGSGTTYDTQLLYDQFRVKGNPSWTLTFYFDSLGKCVVIKEVAPSSWFHAIALGLNDKYIQITDKKWSSTDYTAMITLGIDRDNLVVIVTYETVG